jgi:hypothetical protein
MEPLVMHFCLHSVHVSLRMKYDVLHQSAAAVQIEILYTLIFASKQEAKRLRTEQQHESMNVMCPQ